MHHTQLKSAVKKYQPLFTAGATSEELAQELGNDEKLYTSEDIAQILSAITAGPKEVVPEPAVVPTTPPSKKQVTDEDTDVATYEEWRMERSNGVLVKLKKVRSNVNITEQEAEILNSGANSNGAVNPIMYFLPQ